jgi:lipoprotein-anchoring transpeptidase ErfK/SrfK
LAGAKVVCSLAATGERMRILGYLILVGQLLTPAAADAGPLTAESINAAQWSKANSEASSAAVLKAQVLLSRAGFSSGVIDGRDGENFRKALAEFQRRNGLDASGKFDAATFAKLIETSVEPAVTDYEITAADIKGPFVKDIPRDFEKMADLDRLAYRSPREHLAEQFHMSEDLLKALNPKKSFDEAGNTIVVANVRTGEADARQNGNTGSREAQLGKQPAKAARIEVNKTERALRVFADDGGLIAYYPASVGSEEKPAPSGKFEVRAIAKDPVYRYKPEFAFKGQKATEEVEIAPGPNNPVGAVWIALSAETYGIHGTPDPDKVGKTASHGCVRLTNWDALALAKMVRRGTPVELVD